MQHTMSEHRQRQLVETLLDQMRPILCAFVAQIGEHPLHELEAEVSQVGQHLAQQVLTTTVGTVAPAYPETTVPCRCGAVATYQRRRPATVITAVGRITYRRPYYRCATCRQGQCPLDAQFGWCAGSLSATVQQHLATLGATLPFARAAQLFADLCHVQVSAPTVRRATQQVGQQVAALPTVAGVGPYQPHYVSADGVMVAVRGEGWKEVRVGSVYTTRQRRHGPRAHRMRYCGPRDLRPRPCRPEYCLWG